MRAAEGAGDNYIDALRKELLYLIERELTPLAMKYGYSDVPLESKIKWKPMVLLLGNYSSGKSTLINELIGFKVQHTGQAPTDDCFTVITGDEQAGRDGVEGQVLEERDGKVLLNDDQYPFDMMRQHGERFAAHFRLKKVRSEVLQNLAIIDTPGMLDSIAERDRGYNYQQVVGDFAQLADLVLVLFDPHKAGTVRESYASLRETLPEKTFEDRLIFVLNRVDECASLEDLLRVYGTLCWNLSQMTGRKDIPRILLTYAKKKIDNYTTDGEKSYLRYLDNQREELQRILLDAPRHRLDHLVSFLELHSYRLQHFLEAVHEFARRKKNYFLKASLAGLVASLFFGALMMFYLDLVKPFEGQTPSFGLMSGLAALVVTYLTGQVLLYKYMNAWYHDRALAGVDRLVPLDSQRRKDSWHHIRGPLVQYLSFNRGSITVGTTRREKDMVQRIYTKSAKEIRSAINEGASRKNEGRA